jgi:hypothetical protein
MQIRPPPHFEKIAVQIMSRRGRLADEGVAA